MRCARIFELFIVLIFDRVALVFGAIERFLNAGAAEILAVGGKGVKICAVGACVWRIKRGKVSVRILRVLNRNGTRERPCIIFYERDLF